MFMSCRFLLQPRHVDGVLYVDFYGISTVNKREVAVGGNGRVQTASDTWPTPEHRTMGVERPVPTCFAL